MNRDEIVARLMKEYLVCLLFDGFWGDAGKERIAHILAPHFDVMTSGTGGPNSGRTIYPRSGMKRILHHLLVSIYLGKPCVLGNGKVINPEIILREIVQAAKDGFPVDGLLHISERAHVIMPWHRALDEANEDAGQGVGSTKHGIAYVYMFKAARKGIRMIHLIDSNKLRRKMQEIRPFVNGMMTAYDLEPYDDEGFDRVYKEMRGYGQRLEPYVTDTAYLLNQAIDGGQSVLGLCVNGVGLDLDHGSGQFVTSSNATTGGTVVGTGIAPTCVDATVMVSRAYGARVGDGPFPTELENEIGDLLRQQGGEYGSTTGRPRRCGWLDLVYLRYAAMLNRPAFMVMTKLDVLSGIGPLSVCVGYKLDGRSIDQVPTDSGDLGRVVPIYEELPGWTEDIGGVTEEADLPANARAYVRRVEELLGVPISIVCTGPEQQQYLAR